MSSRLWNRWTSLISLHLLLWVAAPACSSEPAGADAAGAHCKPPGAAISDRRALESSAGRSAEPAENAPSVEVAVVAQSGAGRDARNCPLTAPTVGASCSGEGKRCGYDPEWLDEHPPLCVACSCRDSFECRGGAWDLVSDAECCSVPAAPACPETLPADTAACPTTGLECRYGGALCQCSPAELSDDSSGELSCAAQPSWHCYEPPGACPKLRPALGEACDDPSAVCDYSQLLCCGPFTEVRSLACSDGVWVQGGGGECT